jgi:hypothetical protein
MIKMVIVVPMEDIVELAKNFVIVKNVLILKNNRIIVSNQKDGMMMANVGTKHRKSIIKWRYVILILKQHIVVQHQVIVVPEQNFATAKDASIINNSKKIFFEFKKYSNNLNKSLYSSHCTFSED